MQQRNFLLDILKGIAILAVIFYHADILPNGYLGVEMFLVIGGYLTTKSAINVVTKGGYVAYLSKRLSRLWPLALVAIAISFLLGWLYIFPWTFKLQCESVAASSIFANNVVQYITSGDYWNGDNLTKPLMHTWYIGIMMQFYMVYPLLFLIAKKLPGEFERNASKVLCWVFCLSLFLYLSPLTNDGQDFYLLPSRLFEFAVGGLLAIPCNSKNQRNVVPILCFATMALGILVLLDLNSPKMHLLATVCISAIFVLLLSKGEGTNLPLWLKPVAYLGMASYSLYLWHQVIFAYYRLLCPDLITSNVLSFSLLITICLIIGVLSYKYLEVPMGNVVRSRKGRKICLGACGFVAMFLIVTSAYYYKNNGVVRDYPEFDVFAERPFDNIPVTYTDRINELDKDFEDNGRKNVLVIGDSYGRDWSNVLLESGVDSVANISYHMDDDSVSAARIMKADVIFIANNTLMSEEYAYVAPYLLGRNYYRVGGKSFDVKMQSFYTCSVHDNLFYNKAVKGRKHVLNINKLECELFGDRYIDVQSAMSESDGMVRLFTADHKLITPDHGHFTKAGAQLCAKRINVYNYINTK